MKRFERHQRVRITDPSHKHTGKCGRVTRVRRGAREHAGRAVVKLDDGRGCYVMPAQAEPAHAVRMT